MKQIELFMSQFDGSLFVKPFALTATRRLYTLVAIFTFFLIMTAQLFWSTIHGDGAVYAWLIREVSQAGFFSVQLPKWTQTQFFADHPYLFFYFGALFTKIFGFSDLALKLPNFAIATLSIWVLYKLANLRHSIQERAHQIGLICGYVLIFDAAYMLQISQPSLDPLAHLLSLVSVIFMLYYRRSFWSGFFLGLAFLTKGVEMLPNLAALFLLFCYMGFRNPRALLKDLVLMFLGVFGLIALWFAVDHFVWGGQWMNTYYTRQFRERFFTQENMQTYMDLGFIGTFVKVYIVELIVLAWGLVKSKKMLRKSDPLFFYFVAYTAINILAFLIIKKNSSQHLTGVLLVGAIFVAEYLWDGWNSSGFRYFQVIPAFLFAASLGYWGWFMISSDKNPDIWTSIKNEQTFFERKENRIPIVVTNDMGESYGLFYTTQWYVKTNKVFFQNEADQLLTGQDVYFLSETSDGKLNKTKLTYQKR